MSQRLDREITELALWYHYNKDRMNPDDLRKRIEFLETALDTYIKLMAEVAKNIQILEGRDPATELWLPNNAYLLNAQRRLGGV